MIKTLIGIPIFKRLDDQAVRLIKSLKDHTDGEYRLYFPVSSRSHSAQINDCIAAARHSGCEYLAVVDADAFFDDKSTGWLQKYEQCLDNHKDFGLLYWSNDFRPDVNEPQYSDESQVTPYVASILWFYRLSNNLWWDENFLYNQSSDIDFVREHRRCNIKTGYLPSIHINHRWDDNSSGNSNYERWKRTNETIFWEKWGSICHDQNFNSEWRNKWRGIYGRQDLDLLKDYTEQWRQIVPYFESTLFNNDKQYVRHNNININDYYTQNEIDAMLIDDLVEMCPNG